MSSISSVPTSLFTTDEIVTGSIFNIKVILILIFICIVYSCLMSFFYDPETSGVQSVLTTKTCICNNDKCKCKSSQENFSNDLFFSYKDTLNPSFGYATTASLISPTENLIGGFASRVVSPKVNWKNPNGISKVNEFALDMYCSLYVLNGNPFAQTIAYSADNQKPVDEHYRVYLVNNAGDKLYIDNLYKNGDGEYKLKFRSDSPEKFLDYNKVLVTFVIQGKETPILTGAFTIG